MFKVVITEYYGPFCGLGGYGSARGVAVSKSPKRADALAKKRLWYNPTTSNENPETGICGGGVPILRTHRIYRNNKLIFDMCD